MLTHPHIALTLPATLTLLYVFITAHTAAWEARGIHPWKTWTLTTTITLTTATITALTLTALHTSLPETTAATILTATLALSAITDTLTGLVPKEPAHLATLMGLLIASTDPTLNKLVILALTTGILWAIPLVAVLIYGGGLGMGDLRLLLATAATLGWWVEPSTLTAAFILACITQLAVTVLIKNAGKRLETGHDAIRHENKKAYKFTLVLSLFLAAAPIWQQLTT